MSIKPSNILLSLAVSMLFAPLAQAEADKCEIALYLTTQSQST